MTNFQYWMTLCLCVSQDHILAQLLQICKDQIVSFHEHESLLDHKQEEELSEAERKDAWAEYEAEVKSCTVQNTNYHEQGSIYWNCVF